MNVIYIAIVVVAGYLLGSLSISILLSKNLLGRDVRRHGSGNAGATNMARVFGMCAGLLTLAGDMLKAAAAMLIGFWLLGERYSLLAAFLITLVDALPVFGTGTVLIPWALAELLLGSVPRGAALVILYLCTLTVRSITEPKLVAAQAGLPPIASLMAMYLGARAFGVAGMVLFPLLLLLAAQMLRTKKEGSM